jgi:hypothetical protein
MPAPTLRRFYRLAEFHRLTGHRRPFATCRPCATAETARLDANRRQRARWPRRQAVR